MKDIIRGRVLDKTLDSVVFILDEISKMELDKDAEAHVVMSCRAKLATASTCIKLIEHRLLSQSTH